MNPLQDLDISTEGHFEKQIFNLFDFQKILTDEGNDPDINCLNNKSKAVNLAYCSIDEFNSSSQKLLKNSFSILHINIRNLNKNFEKLHEYLSFVKRDFSVVSFTEKWCKAAPKFIIAATKLQPFHQIKNNGQIGGVVALYDQNSLDFNILKNKVLTSMIQNVHVSKLLEKTPRI